MKISILAYKTEYGHWAFDHEHMNTVAEPLCNGTDLVMDQYFEIDIRRKPVAGDQMLLHVNTEDFDDSDTVLILQSTNELGTDYLDMVLFEKVWLCPWLQSYFGCKPDELYVQLIPVNPGLKNIQTNYAHPFNKYIKNKNNGEKDISGIHI